MSALDENVKVDLLDLVRPLIYIRPYLGLLFRPKTNVPRRLIAFILLRSNYDSIRSFSNIDSIFEFGLKQTPPRHKM
jgi:hypothetical protein